MSKRRVVALARKVRRAFEAKFVPDRADSNLSGFCGRASAMLLKAAHKAGIEGVEAHYSSTGGHVFNVYSSYKGRWIIDITATQFGIKDRVFVRSYTGRKRPFHITTSVLPIEQEIPFVADDELSRDWRWILRMLKYEQELTL